MANLTYAQLEGIWLQAAAGTKYASQDWAALMAAIAEAESGGNPGSTNPTDNGGRQTSWGLWQISDGTHNAPSPNWNNPLVNAQLAIGKLDNSGPADARVGPDGVVAGLGAWGTYNTGAYKAFISGSTTPDNSAVTDATLLAAESSAGAGSATAQQQGEAECAWKIGWGGIPGTSWLTWLTSLGGSSGNVGSGYACLLSKSQIRGAAGVGLMLVSLPVMFTGLGLVLVGAGLSAGEKLIGLVPSGRAGRALRGAATASAPS